MHIVLLAIGVGIVVIGLALIGLDLAGALGHTLVVAGTIAAIGSLILSSLATVTRQLRRIAQALETRPMARAAEPEETPSAAAASAASPLRAPVVEPLVAPAYEPEPEVRIEPKVEPLPEPVRAAEPEPAPQVAEQPPEVAVEEPAPLAPKPEPDRSFDAVWSGTLDQPAREPAPTAAAVGVAVVEAARPTPVAPPPVPEVSIFKSGVIDGMAYTLYTDGSIEAELPQGTVKFASIDELRAYLTARE
jgi:outer membrane biosynthesis protein TonB